MKKIYTLLSVLCVVGMGTAQVTVDDFENTSKQWNTVSCGNEIVDNPHQTGLNVSCKCLQITRETGCENWSGAIYTLPQAITGYSYVHALMYRNNAHNPNLKITDNGTNLDMTPMNTIIANQWQDVVFDISDKAQADFVMFMADRDDITEAAVVLIDDIIFSNDATPRTTPNTPCEGSTPVIIPNGEWQMVWSDEFNGTGLDLDIWNIEVNGNGGGNNELQYYCEKAVSVQDGNLVLTATKEEYLGKHCTSGRVNSKNKVYFTHGKIEASIKLPSTANGLWPAFWMMGNDFDQVGWPSCGEIDILEMGHVDGINAGTQNRYFNGACHWGYYVSGNYPNYAQASTWSYSLQDGNYHTFTCIWNDDELNMYVDLDTHPSSSPYYTLGLADSDDDWATGKYFHKPFFILFNLAVGGVFPSIYDINNVTALASGPRSMYVDWVRVYQKGDASETFHGKTGQATGNTFVPVLESKKILRNGQLLIIRGDKVYTITGQIVE